jgi:glutamine amidotransferase
MGRATLKIGIVSCGAGNLVSVMHGLHRVGADPRLVENAGDLRRVSKIIIPGVGAFGSAMRTLDESGMADELRRQASQGKALLGICLGAQLLFSTGEEGGLCPGLGILSGHTKTLRGISPEKRLPHTGWNRVQFVSGTGTRPEFGPELNGYYFFNHEYFFAPSEPTLSVAHTEYGARFSVAAGLGSILAVQFHPEKSQDLGLDLLHRFVAAST